MQSVVGRFDLYTQSAAFTRSDRMQPFCCSQVELSTIRQQADRRGGCTDKRASEYNVGWFKCRAPSVGPESLRSARSASSDRGHLQQANPNPPFDSPAKADSLFDCVSDHLPIRCQRVTNRMRCSLLCVFHGSELLERRILAQAKVRLGLPRPQGYSRTRIVMDSPSITLG